MTEERTRTCSRCRVTKTWSEYYLKPRGKYLWPGAQCKVCHRAAVQAWKVAHPGQKERRKRQKREAAIGTPVRCAICGNRFTGKKQHAPHFDHNHETGGPRGWLCSGCNGGLGLFGDNPRILQAAATYLLAKGHAVTRSLVR